jgi:hypothetical protein
MTKSEFKKEAQKRVEDTLRRREEFGTLNDEPDFLAGAMSVMILVNEKFFGTSYEKSMDIVSPVWVFAPIRGDSVLDTPS